MSAATKAHRARTRRNWLLSLPALILLLAAASGPLIVVAIYSFRVKGDFSGVGPGWTTSAWTSIFRESDIFDPGVTSWADAHLTIFWRSVKLSLLTTAAAFLMGFPMAWYIATRNARQRMFWLFLITIPFWTNLLIRTFAINEILRNEGVLNLILLKTGLIATPVQMLYTDGAILIGMVYVYLPLMVLPLYAAIERFDLRLLEAAHDLYASRLQVLRRVILPLVRPGIVAGSILVFVPSLGAYVTPRILGGGKNMMIGNFIELQFGQGRNWPLGSALSMLLLIVVTAALLIYVRTASDRGAR